MELELKRELVGAGRGPQPASYEELDIEEGSVSRGTLRLDTKERRDDGAAACKGMYVIHLQLHGLLRGHSPEIGWDVDAGGQVGYVLDLVGAQARSAAYERVEVITRLIEDPRVSEDYGKPVEGVSEGAYIYRYAFGPKGYVPKHALWPFLAELVELLRQHIALAGRRPDWIHAHYADAACVGSEICTLLDIPLIFTPHSLGRYKLRSMAEHGRAIEADMRGVFQARIDAEERALACAVATTTNCAHERQELQMHYENFAGDRVHVLSAGVDSQIFRPPAADEDHAAFVELLTSRGLADTSRRPILAAARLHHTKNLPMLVSCFAASQLLRNTCNLVLLLGAARGVAMSKEESAIRTEIDSLIHRHGLHGQVACMDGVPRPLVSCAFRYATALRGVFVNPALVEPLGLTLLEAAASGLPVVASHGGGPAQIISSCEHGLAIDTSSDSELAAAIETLCAERELWATCSQNGIRKASLEYTWSRHASRLAELAASSLESRRRGATSLRVPRWLPGVVQFLSSAAVSCILKFNVVFWHSLGFEGAGLALLSISSLVGLFVGSIFWGVLTDIVGGVKTVLLTAHLLSVLAVACNLLDAVRGSTAALAAVSAMAGCLLSADFGVVDSLCLASLSKEEVGEYGGMRAWNCLGCGIASAAMGAVIPVFGIDAIFQVFAALQLPFLVLVGLFVPDAAVNQANSRMSLGSLLECLGSRDSVVFFANLFIYGISLSLIEVYGPIYYMDFLRGSTATVGLAVFIMCVAEVVVFKYINGAIQFLKLDWVRVFQLCHGILVLRYLIYSMTPPSLSPVALANEMLHGINFAAMWFVAVQRADELAPEGARATMQSLASSLYFFLSFGLGGLLWGTLIQEAPAGVGWRLSFWLSSGATLVWAFVWSWLIYHLFEQ